MYDVLLALYEGKSLSGTLLGVLNCESAQMNFNRLGGPGSATYGIQTEMSSTVANDLVSPNRLDAYCRSSILVTSITSGQVAINVSHPQDIVVGQKYVIWDGENTDFFVVEAVAGASVGFTPALSHSYSVGATVMQLTHRGMIQSVDLDAQLQDLQKVTTISYFQELNNLALAGGDFNTFEAGYVLYYTLLQYTAELDLVVSPGNFVFSNDGTLGYGTKQNFTANYSGGTQMSQFIQDIINAANGNSANIASSTPVQYSLWCDVNNILYFNVVNETTPTLEYSLNTYTADIYNVGQYNCLSDYSEHVQDTTGICNLYYMTGGNTSSASTTPITCVVQDDTSIAVYGNIEQAVSLPNITDVNTLSAAGAGMLTNSAFPIDTFTAIITPVAKFATAQDCVHIIGFEDGSDRVFALQSVTIEWTAETFGQFKMTLQGGQVRPNISNALAKINYHNTLNSVAVTQGQYSNLEDRIIVTGLDASYATNQFTTTAGIFQANVGVIQSNENYYTDIYTIPPTTNSNRLELTLNITGSAYVTLSNTSGATKTFTVAGSYSGTDTGGQRTYTGSTTFHYYDAAETTGGTWTWTVQEGTLGSTWSGHNASTSLNGSYYFPFIPINNTVTELNEFPVSANTFTIPNSGVYTIGYLYQNTDGTIFSTPELILFQGTSTSSYTPYQYCPLYRVTCIGGGITGFKKITARSGVANNHLAGNPAPSVAPQFAVLPSAFTYIGSGSGSYAAGTSWTLTQGKLPWLSEVRYYALEHGGGSSARHAVGDLAPTANGQYSAFWSGLSGGVQYDLYICFVDNQSNESAAVLLGTTAANALSLSRANQASGAAGVTPTASSISLVASITNGTSNDVEIQFTPDSLGYSSNDWLAEIVLVTAALGTSAWSVCTSVPPIASGTYSPIWNGTPKGAGQQFGFQYVDYQGNFSNVCYLLTTTQTNIVHGANSETVLGVVGADGSNPSSTAGINMVYNSNFAIYTPPTGAVSQYASAARVDDTNYGGSNYTTPNGFSRNFESANAGEGTIAFVHDGAQGSIIVLQDGSVGGNSYFGCVTDAIPVVGGQSYTFQIDVSFGYGVGSVPSGAAWWWSQLWYKAGATDFSRGSADLIQYDALVSASTTDPNWSTTTGTLTAPAGAGFCRIVVYHWGATGGSFSGAYNLGFRNLAMYKADLHHSLMSPGVQAQINSSGAITNINNISGTATLPYINHDSGFRNVISSGGQYNVSQTQSGTIIPYANHGTAITNVISSGSVVNINNTSGNLAYSNAPGAVTTALNSVGTLQGIGSSRFSTATTGSFVTGTTSTQTFTVGLSLPVISGAQWYVEAQWTIVGSNCTISASMSGASSVATSAYSLSGSYTFIQLVSVATGLSSGGSVTVTYTSAVTGGGSQFILPGLITYKAFRIT